MAAALVGAVITALAVMGALSAFAFWQAKRAARADDERAELLREQADLKLDIAARKVEVVDLTRALNEMTAERDRLEFAIDTVEDQRDALIKEALQDGNPRAVAHSIRDALKRLRPAAPEEEVPDVSPGSAD